ncbi:uncharacterized protein [Pyrus communis]|uniref:uncharacterized protein isoform X1 n=1 Tax=Pyrus communis TaxID=23211 RepID=UPI0035BED0CC
MMEVQWLEKDGNVSINDGIDLYGTLFRRLSMAYSGCSAAILSLGGLEFSSKAARTSILGADNLQTRDLVSEEPYNSLMLGKQDTLQTLGVSSQRLSIGMTPKTVRFPKPGEMLISVHGSPLGVYKEDNMEAIHELEEG